MRSKCGECENDWGDIVARVRGRGGGTVAGVRYRRGMLQVLGVLLVKVDGKQWTPPPSKAGPAHQTALLYSAYGPTKIV